MSNPRRLVLKVDALPERALRCPACRATGSEVIETREAPFSTRRRRRCPACDHRWTTDERVGVVPPGRQLTRRPGWRPKPPQPRTPPPPTGPPPGVDGDALANRRLELELSQAELGRRAGVGRETVGRIERWAWGRPPSGGPRLAVRTQHWVAVERALAEAEAERGRP